MTPKVSVIMAVYNNELYIKEAVESILQQTYKDFELIIINDGSTDDTLKVFNQINDERIKIITQKNEGPGSARNKGIKSARGKYVANLDSDDICLPERLEKQVEFLENNPDYVIVGSNGFITDSNGTIIYASSYPLTDDEIRAQLPETPFINSAVMFRKEAALKAGGYYERINNYKIYCEDCILWNRMADLGKYANIKEPLIYYRLSPTAITTKSATKRIGGKLLRKIIDNKELSKNDVEYLQKINNNESKKNKEAVYYYHISKKILWCQNNRKMCFQYILASIKKDPAFIKSYFILILLLLPDSLRKKLYKG
jgi:glycosyltransferase involved in cell wall biosynthesis